jgi:xylulokinase
VSVFGLDVGTSAVKGIAVDPEGLVVAKASRTYPLLTPRPGWSEQDPERWWRASQEVLAELRARAGAPQSIGLSGQMHGLVTLGRDSRPLRPAILWNDQRTSVECEEIEALLGFERLVSLTGNRALTGFTAPKLLWLRRHEPEVYRQIETVLLPKDYVRLRLCGERASDVSDASGTLLFDVANRRWSEPVLGALEVPSEWLPRVLESAEVSGYTADGVPVAAGAGDQAAGAIGVGVDRPGPASVVLGTSGVVFTALERFVADPEARTHTFCHAVPGTWHAMGVMLSAAGSLEWLRRVVASESEFSQLLKEADSWPPGSEGLIFLPYLAGERTPHGDPNARGAFVGLTLRHDRGALTRAVLEGVAFGLRDCLDVLPAAGAVASSGRVSGGGARSELWLRIVGSVLELPLSRTMVDEGAAFGAALLAGVAGGVWRDVAEAIAAAVKVTGTVEPDPAWSAQYREVGERFRALYPALRDATTLRP